MFVSVKPTTIKTPWGLLLATWSDVNTLTRLVFLEDSTSFSSTRFLLPSTHHRRPPSNGLRLLPEGTDFQRSVWQEVFSLKTQISYRDLALRLNIPAGQRAVASALSANPLALLVPCHLVCKQDGSLGGYRWGLERKEALLKLPLDQVRGVVLTALGFDAKKGCFLA